MQGLRAQHRLSKRLGLPRLKARVFTFTCLPLLFLCSLAIRPLATAAPPPDSIAPLIAIGDVHGDFDDFCAILRKVGLIDEQHRWTGGKTVFVQTGDLIDRGPKPREVMDLVMSLQEQASNSGGQVVALLGNHEVMNLMGDLRYVTAENFASFADKESEIRQKTGYQDLCGVVQIPSAAPGGNVYACPAKNRGGMDETAPPRIA